MVVVFAREISLEMKLCADSMHYIDSSLVLKPAGACSENRRVDVGRRNEMFLVRSC